MENGIIGSITSELKKMLDQVLNITILMEKSINCFRSVDKITDVLPKSFFSPEHFFLPRFRTDFH